ncbi:MAG: hypothetical protein CMM01_01295 [Rhodopirellula sp.]|nr:hypothetical protein [Rhodopirellula sp.]OUX52500.1 MAG: hypothetical protein CBE43_00535 [Rhodopirellula sp. TMED283]
MKSREIDRKLLLLIGKITYLNVTHFFSFLKFCFFTDFRGDSSALLAVLIKINAGISLRMIARQHKLRWVDLDKDQEVDVNFFS